MGLRKFIEGEINKAVEKRNGVEKGIREKKIDLLDYKEFAKRTLSRNVYSVNSYKKMCHFLMTS